MAITAAG